MVEFSILEFFSNYSKRKQTANGASRAAVPKPAHYCRNLRAPNISIVSKK